MRLAFIIKKEVIMDALIVLSYLAIIFLAGILCSIISTKLKISNILLLVLAGIVLNKIKYNGASLIQFPGVFLTSMSIFALAMIVFDASSRLKLREFNRFSISAVKLTITFLILNIIFLTFFSWLVIGVKSIFLAALFAALMSGTDPDAVMAMLGNFKSKAVDILKIESLINTPVVVLVPFIILDIMGSIKAGMLMTNFLDKVIPFLQQFVVGIGAGILMGIIMLKAMKKAYSELLSPFAIITAALLTYIIAENLKGNGVLAVTAMGLFFGNIYVKEKNQLIEFSSLFANFLEIIVFILVGLSIELPFNKNFLIKSFILFILYLLIRFAAISFSLRQAGLSFREKLFMTLNVQKGIAVAAIALSLTTYSVQQISIVEGVKEAIKIPFISLPGAVEILHLTLLFMLYSIILSTIVIKLSKYFIEAEIRK